MGSKSPIVEVNRQKVDMGNTMNTILREISETRKICPPQTKKKFKQVEP